MNRTPAETALSKAMIRWSLSRATLIAETRSSWIYRVEQNGRAPAVLKQFKPGAGDEKLRGSALLAWYGGQGAATVFDAADGVLFMEWLDGRPLGDAARAGHDEEATIAIATLIKELHRPRDADPPPLLPLRLHFRALFEARAALWPAQSRDLLARAIGIGHRLFDKPAPSLPLHGDLHHDNILSSPRGWLAIDPKGLVGDPAYETASIFLNPAAAPGLVNASERIARLVDMFSARLGFPRRHILAHAVAHAALSACWDVGEHRPITAQLAVMPLLLTAYEMA